MIAYPTLLTLRQRKVVFACADALLPPPRDLLPCARMQDDSAAAEAAQDEWGAGEGATVRSPLLDRARPYAVPAGRAESDPALPRPADLPRVAVRAEHGGHRGDQGGLYFDYGGVWGADPVGETPKPYPVTTEEPPPPHWGLEERESTVEDTALDEASKEVQAEAHLIHVDLMKLWRPSHRQMCSGAPSLHQVNKQPMSAAGVHC